MNSWFVRQLVQNHFDCEWQVSFILPPFHYPHLDVVDVILDCTGSTAVQSLNNALKVYANRPLFGRRIQQSNGTLGQYVFTSYAHAHYQALSLACSMKNVLPALPSTPSTSSPSSSGAPASGVVNTHKVGICSSNRSEWLIADFACAFNGYTSVGIHTTWPSEVGTLPRS